MPKKKTSKAQAVETADDIVEAAANEAVAAAVADETSDAVAKLTDLIEYEIEMIFVDRDGRQDRWNTLTYLMNLHPAKAVEYGRLCTRRLIAAILVDVCGSPPYGTQDVSAAGSPTKKPASVPEDSLAVWTRSQWDDLMKNLRVTRGFCLRNDATTVVADDSGLGEDEEESEARSKSSSFGRKLDLVIKVSEMNKALAPIRAALEAQLGPDEEGPAKVDDRKLAEVVKYIDRMDEGDKAKESLLQLFVEKDSGLALKNLEDLWDICTDKPFHFDWFQTKLEVLMTKWSLETFGAEDPILVKLRYRIPGSTMVATVVETPKSARRKHLTPRPKSMSKAELEELKEGREALKTQHGEDPLPESREIAAEAAAAGVARKRSIEDDDEQATPKKRHRGEALYMKKATATQIQFMDDLDEDDAEDEKERAQLSDVPKRRKITPKKYTGPPPEQGVFASDGKVLKRRKWTEEEKNAVKVGVETCGVGKWVDIKNMYPELLRNRTPVQVKDCWRTMNKNKELDIIQV